MRWTHVAIIHDSSTGIATMLWDGVVQASAVMQTPVRKSRLHSAIGQESVVSYNATFYGSLDGLLLWHSARTQAEVVATMSDTSSSWRYSSVLNSTLPTVDLWYTFEPVVSNKYDVSQYSAIRSYTATAAVAVTVTDGSYNHADGTTMCNVGCLAPSTRRFVGIKAHLAPCLLKA